MTLAGVDMLTTREAAELIGITRQGFEALARREGLKPADVERVFHYRLFRRADVERVKAEREARARERALKSAKRRVR